MGGITKKKIGFVVDVVAAVAVAVGIGSCGVQSLSSLFILLHVLVLLLILINEHRFHQYVFCKFQFAFEQVQQIVEVLVIGRIDNNYLWVIEEYFIYCVVFFKSHRTSPSFTFNQDKRRAGLLFFFLIAKISQFFHQP